MRQERRMADIVLGIGASHTTLMNTQWAKVDHLARAHRFRDALAAAARRLAEARPDAVVIVGSNHFRGFWLDLMPAFTIGVGEVISSGEHGTPEGVLRSDAELGRHLCQSLIARDFDIAFSTRLTIDHGISHAYQWLLTEVDAPIVPIVINCFAPPLPSLRRACALGDALRAALQSSPGAQRIAVIGTGGLSHTLPFPDWRDPQSDDDAYLVGSWREGRGRWHEFEQRRRQIIVGAEPRVNENFDLAFLDGLERGLTGQLPDLIDDEALIKTAGNGAAELRAWLVMTAALNQHPGEVLAYSPMPEWLTGMAVAVVPKGEH
jgi:2,3-dihydroxyphenylpropionate 1,2-dioxygenase